MRNSWDPQLRHTGNDIPTLPYFPFDDPSLETTRSEVWPKSSLLVFELSFCLKRGSAQCQNPIRGSSPRVTQLEDKLVNYF
jgi:hypothetical protein